MKKHHLAVSSSVLALSCLLVGCAANVDDFENVDSSEQEMHSWGSYHWGRTSNPFTVVLLDNVTSAWDSYLATASSDWSQSQVLNTTIQAGVANPKTCKATAGKVQVCNANYGNNGWLGLASIWLSGGHISQGTVKLNDTYYSSSTYNTPAWRASVMCQEIGHTFGLGHNDEDFNTINGTCMDYANNPSQNQHPDQHDYQQLESIYAHLDSVNTTSSAAPIPPALGSANFEAMEEWGELEHTSPSGHVHTYIREFGPYTLITNVSWAPE